MEAGALGVEIIISGKLRTERARFEKFREGYLPKSGEPALQFLHKAELHVQLKPGIYGIKVRIMPPDATFPDQVQILETIPEEKIEATEKAETTTEAVEPEEKETKTEETKKPKKKPEKPETPEKESEPAVSQEKTEEAGQ
jgi:small subunit ribosomal protein S3